MKTLFYIIFISILSFNFAFAISGEEFKQKLDSAKKQNKKVIIDFYTDWCSWCKKMDKDTYGDAEVKQVLDKHFVFIKLNAESSDVVEFNNRSYTKAQLARAFGVTGYPATGFIDSDMTPLTLVPGYIDKTTFLKIIKFFGENHYKTKSFDQYEKESKNNSK